ncbi:phytanoyl-CoA dioxygenase PhyH [Paraburkholderia sp. BL6669N2]|uniref:phytanoyl-CoA dioxygenase family protein n=1 Tax=Paraburkholderia sp. BL6669N2 TaxID=1938807 RepID=UPI000E270B43|nr:phytanoyl-CoA dioxygenase family protein [Paraburkholderia sp. BL6669N2]REG50889.1 phytanoyl-CoA dioxygenase PhyH [Paraburkholderia sp. BL6669N2]
MDKSPGRSQVGATSSESALDVCGFSPAEGEIQTYEQMGYYITPRPILPPDLIARAIDGVERYYCGERDWSLPISGGFLDWRPEHGGLLRINDYVSLQNEGLHALCTYGAIASIAGRLARARAIRLFHDQLITKMPSSDGATAVGWHVDKAYWRACTSEKLLTAWIPLVDIDENSGGIAFVSESHRQPLQDWMTTFNDQNLDQLAERAQKAGITMRAVTPTVPLGHVSFHHGRTIHGSKPNRGHQPRIALTVHFQDQDNRYQLVADSHGRPVLHVNDLLCRRGPDGLPDYADPDVCPTLWSEEDPR